MFLIAPKEEATGEVTLAVEDAKKKKAKYEGLYRLRPNAKNANSLACIYHVLGEGHKAMELIDMIVEAMTLANGDAPAAMKSAIYQNRGMFLRAFGRFAESGADIAKAWDLDKSSAYVGMARAEEHLRNGEWAEGWELHNRVRGTCEGAALAIGLPLECKFWDGQEHPRHLMVINEGGAGDRINYTRWLPLLTERSINWSFFCFDELKPFYDRLPWIGPERTIGEKDKTEFSPMPSHWTTTFALPGPLGVTPATIPEFPTSFTPPPNKFNLDNPDGLPVVGLCWNANELFQGGLKIRSLTEGQAMRLVCATAHKIHWVNLQHGHKMPYPVINVPFETWQDTSMVLAKLDALATVDCGTLWLSLAMKKQTAVLLTAPEDWKFTSGWGSHLTKYRNGESSEPFDAEKAIDKLIIDIRKGEWPHGPTSQGN